MDEVIITDHDPNWAVLFQQESELLQTVLGNGLIARIEHFGSTAVPGLAAKPVIDILVGVYSLQKAKQAAILPLRKLGYAYWADNPDPERLFFVNSTRRTSVSLNFCHRPLHQSAS